MPDKLPMSKIEVILLAHGSRLQQANDDVLQLAEQLQQNRPKEDITTRSAFLQFGKPSLQESIDAAVHNGCQEVLIAPLFLTPGVHINEDIPEILKEAEEKYPEIRFTQCRLLGCDNRLVPILWERIQDQLA